MKTFKLAKNFNGRIYRLKASEVLDFYNEQVFKLSQRGKRLANEFHVTGTVLLRLFHADLQLKDVRMGYNLVVNTGKDAVIDRLQAAAVAVHDYQAIGTGTNAAAAGDTALQTEVARGQGALTQPTSTTDRLVTTFAAGTGTGAITETGRLNAASTGNLFARQVFSVVNKAAG
jgi:hypothetical protein